MQLLAVGILFGVFAYCKFEKNNFKSWLLILLPLIFLLLSADEFGQIHDRIGQISDILLPKGDRKETFFRNTGIWMFVVGIPFIIIFFFLLNSIKQYFKNVNGVLSKLIVGIIIMLVGALFIESISNLWERGTKGHLIEVYIEESFEMIGVTFMLWAAHDLLVQNNFRMGLGEEKNY